MTGIPAEPPYSPAQARKIFYDNVRATFPDPVLEHYLARAERAAESTDRGTAVPGPGGPGPGVLGTEAPGTG